MMIDAAMLTLSANKSERLCDGLSRRDFLRVGSLGVAGLSLPWLLAEQARASAADKSYMRDKSVVLLFLCGGPSQFETFDPNMTAPAPWCSLTGEVQTALPGVTFGATFPKLAERADRLAVVRSYAPHEIADHAMAIRHVLRAGDPLKGEISMGSIATRLTGSNHPTTGMPRYATLIEDESDSQYQEDMVRMRTGSQPGALGATCTPFASNSRGQAASDMRLSTPLERLDDRRRLLASLDKLKQEADSGGQLAASDRFAQQAVDVILGGHTQAALDLSKEDPRTVERYDTSRWQTGWLTKRESTIGRQMLLARRLVEAGCGFVTVGYAGWDNHGNDKHPGVVGGMHLLGTPLDHCVSAFLGDLAERGLSDKVLLVITGEFGRSPKIQAQGGRDHWPGLCPLVFAGGGLKMGQVIGRSTRRCDAPATEPYRLDNLFGTIMHTLFDAGKLRVAAGAPPELVRVIDSAKPIDQLLP